MELAESRRHFPFDRLGGDGPSIPAAEGDSLPRKTAVTDLVITATLAADLFSMALVLAYDVCSTVVWRR